MHSRYYDPATCRFINADKFVSTGQGIIGYNMFAYCLNSPVNRVDRSGHWPQWIEDAIDWLEDTFNSLFSRVFRQSANPSNILQASSDENTRSLPKNGEPGSSKTLKKPDGTPKQKRWYGPDGNPERDRDYDHPGSMPFPHDHEWKDGKRGEEHLPPSPEYKIAFEPLIGIGLIFVCGIGAAIVAADDATGLGIADDYLLIPLGEGFGRGLVMVFG